MGLFGPKYPPPLQEAVHHAKRFCQQLSRWGQRGGFASARATAWMSGRAGEVEVVLALKLSDWRNERLTTERAARSVADYVLELHDAARAALGLAGELVCCCDELRRTENVSDAAVARPRTPRPKREPAEEANDTWFDPGGVLRELESEGTARAEVAGQGLVGPGTRKG